MCSSSYLDKNQESLGIRWYHWNHECNLHIELEKKNNTQNNPSKTESKQSPTHQNKTKHIHQMSLWTSQLLLCFCSRSAKCLPSPYPHSLAVACSTGSLAHTPGLHCRSECSRNHSWMSPVLPRRNHSHGAVHSQGSLDPSSGLTGASQLWQTNPFPSDHSMSADPAARCSY